MASAGTVTVDFAAETAKFTAELKKVQSSLGRLEDKLVSFEKVSRLAFRFFTAGALISFAKSALAAADATGDAAERAGIAVESFSRLQFAAGQTDVEISALTSGITKFQVAISKASTGSKDALANFARFGIEIDKLTGLSIEDQLGEVAEAFRRMTDPADRTRLAIELFGKSAGPQLVPLLARGRDGIKELTEAADRLGATLDTRAVAGIDRAAKALERLKLGFTGGFSNIVGSFIANTFGSGDEIADTEARIRALTARRNELLTVPNSLSKDGLAQQISIIDGELNKLQGTIKRLKFEQSPKGMQLLELPWIEQLREVQAIDIEAIKALKINVDELGMAFARLDQSIADIQQARSSEALQLVTEAVLEGQRQIEQQVTSEFQAELDKRVAASQAARQFELTQEQALQQSLRGLRAGTVNAAISALQSFAGHSKKVAIALVLINKARAIATVIQDTAAAAVKAIAVYGPTPAGFAAAATAKAFGAAQIALIAASGLGEIQSINRSGGAPPGSPANPIFTSGPGDQQELGASTQRTVQVTVQGNVIGNQQFIDDLIESIRDAVDGKDVVLISSTSRNAKELLGA